METTEMESAVLGAPEDLPRREELAGDLGRKEKKSYLGDLARLLDSQLWKLEAARRGRRTTS